MTGTIPAPIPYSIGAGVLSGLLLVLATSPLGVGLVAFVALVPVLRVIAETDRARVAALAGLACGLVYFGAGFVWVPANLGGRAWAVWAVGVPLLALPVAGVTALLAWIARTIRPSTALLLAPPLWAALEALRALGPIGIGWLRLGHALAESPSWIQLASLGGVILLSAWSVAVSAAIAHALPQQRPAAWSLSIATFLVGIVPGGVAVAAIEAPRDGAFRVAAIQPAIPAERRFAPKSFDANLGRLLESSRRAIAADPADLVVWPESAFEQPAGPNGALFLGAIASSLDTPLLAGARRVAIDRPGMRWNSAVLATPDGDTRVLADKRRPLPLYERAPEGWLAGALARVAALPGRVLAGALAEPHSIGARDGTQRRVGVLVCVDAAFPDLARELRARGADLLVSIANEAESGTWSARQHALLVRLRAVETGLPLVRVANGGPSVWIDPMGREVARLDLGSGARTVAVGAAISPPLYTSLGDAPVLAVLFLPGLVSAARFGLDARVRKRRLSMRSPS